MKSNFVLRKKNIMVTYCISSQCIIALLSAEDSSDLRDIVSSCLQAAGRSLWRDIDADVFFSRSGEIMLIARPASPVRMRVSAASPRLLRRR